MRKWESLALLNSWQQIPYSRSQRQGCAFRMADLFSILLLLFITEPDLLSRPCFSRHRTSVSSSPGTYKALIEKAGPLISSARDFKKRSDLSLSVSRAHLPWRRFARWRRRQTLVRLCPGVRLNPSFVFLTSHHLLAGSGASPLGLGGLKGSFMPGFRGEGMGLFEELFQRLSC